MSPQESARTAAFIVLFAIVAWLLWSLHEVLLVVDGVCSVGAEKLEQNFLAVMEEAGYELLAIQAASALRAGRLTANHKDPFDRMISAQALGQDIPVLSPDPQFEQFGVRRLW